MSRTRNTRNGRGGTPATSGRYYPRVIGKSNTKLNRYFRKDTSYEIGDPKRYPMQNCIFRHPVVISLGSRKPTDPAILRLNTPEAIGRSSNKVTTKNILAGNIPIVEPYTGIVSTDPDKIMKLVPLPIVAKLKYGSGGKGMIFINSKSELKTFLTKTPNLYKYFLEAYFSIHQEYRIHASPLLDGESCTYSYKYKDKESLQVVTAPALTHKSGLIYAVRKLIKNGTETEGGIRNFDTGNVIFTSKFNKPECFEEMVKASVEAIRLLGLDFGCTDVLYNKETKKFVISEVNSNPGMANSEANAGVENITAQHYQLAFPRMVVAKKSIREVYPILELDTETCAAS